MKNMIKKKISRIIILVSIVIVSILIFATVDNWIFTVLNNPTYDLSTWCGENGVNLPEKSKLCMWTGSQSCTIFGGTYNDCDNRYVDENGTIKISPYHVCLQTCQFD